LVDVDLLDDDLQNPGPAEAPAADEPVLVPHRIELEPAPHPADTGYQPDYSASSRVALCVYVLLALAKATVVTVVFAHP
jgi:hypothetical protein